MIKPAFLAIATILVASIPAFSVTVGGLRCEFLENPEGIDVMQPRLSWVQESDERGARQTAWQVVVASTVELLEPGKAELWDTGKVLGDQSIHVSYAGEPLGSRQACFWKVRLWDKDGKPTPWSEVARWSTGLQPDDWQGSWIGLNTPVIKPPLEEASWIAHPDAGAVEANKPVRHFYRFKFELPKHSPTHGQQQKHTRQTTKIL